MEKEFQSQAYTRIYWLIEDGKIKPDQVFDFLELYWPTFMQKDGYVLLKENYTEEKYNRLVTDKINPEFWINLLTIDDFFSNSENKEKEQISFSKKLVEIWKTKLEKDFPSMEFTVKCIADKQSGDCGLTFYQTKHEL